MQGKRASIMCARVCGRTNDGQYEKRNIKKRRKATVASIANIVSPRIPTSICTRILSSMRWQVPRHIEMREKRQRRKKENERKEREWNREEQKESPGHNMATTLRSGLRAPKSRPVSMPRYRHSFERRCVMRISPVLSTSTASLRLASPRLSRLYFASFDCSHGTAGRNFARGRCWRPRHPVGRRRSRLRLRNYWLSLVVYLAYC